MRPISIEYRVKKSGQTLGKGPFGHRNTCCMKLLKERLSERPRILSLFAGCGGMDLGAHMAGGRTVWANEFNPWAAKTYKNYFPETTLVEKSIEDVDLDRELPKKGTVDLIIGGFPCQDFSMIWKRPGLNGTRGNLYTYFVEIVNRLQPLAFIAENVKGLLSANGGMAIRQIKSDFLSCGYRIPNENVVVNFADYGVPQLRERVLIVGIRRDLKKIFFKPPALHAPLEKYKSLRLKPYVSSKEALKNVEKVKYNNEHQKILASTRSLLEAIPPGGNFSDVPKSHPHYVNGMISHVYRRLHPDFPSTTIIAGGGGGTWGYHFKEPRPLTNRERARLFGYPDDMFFEGPHAEVRRQIGNSVPPTGFKVVAQHLFGILRGEIECLLPQEESELFLEKAA
jgi:DNA (cytosine-5)-methyltransferase 1